MKALGLAVAIVALSAGTGWVAGRISGGALITSGAELEDIRFESLRGTTSRQTVHIPIEYGSLAHVVKSNTGWTLWYKNGNELRNVPIPDALVVVRRGGKVAGISRR